MTRNKRWSLIAVCWMLASPAAPQVITGKRDVSKDKEALITIEEQWLHAKDAATLERILAPDFVHVIPAAHFLNKQEHIDWWIEHPQPESGHTRFDQLNVRIYGATAIVNGSVIATDSSGKELNRSMFTDVFVLRDGQWQAVNAQENSLPASR